MRSHGDSWQPEDELIQQRKPKIQGTEIEIVAQYTYLGIPVDANFSLETIRDEREAAVKRAVESVSGFLRSRNVPTHEVESFQKLHPAGGNIRR